MRSRDRWHDRLKQVEREFVAASIAADLLDERLRVDSGYLKSLKVRPDRRTGTPDAVRMRAALEATYLIRLFAVFEAALREAWELAFGKTTMPRTRDLIEGVAGQSRRMPTKLRDEVHRAREYRNSIVHGGDAGTVELADARRALSRFLAGLPEDW